MDAAWHPDPGGLHELRYWDGAAWTDHVSDQGVVGLDPLPPLPGSEPVVEATPEPEPTPEPAPFDFSAEETRFAPAGVAEPAPAANPWAQPAQEPVHEHSHDDHGHGHGHEASVEVHEAVTMAPDDAPAAAAEPAASDDSPIFASMSTPEPEPLPATQPWSMEAEPEPVATAPEPEPEVMEPEPVAMEPEPEVTFESMTASMSEPEPEPVMEAEPEPEPVMEAEPEPAPADPDAWVRTLLGDDEELVDQVSTESLDLTVTSHRVITREPDGSWTAFRLDRVNHVRVSPTEVGTSVTIVLASGPPQHVTVTDDQAAALVRALTT